MCLSLVSLLRALFGDLAPVHTPAGAGKIPDRSALPKGSSPGESSTPNEQTLLMWSFQEQPDSGLVCRSRCNVCAGLYIASEERAAMAGRGGTA